MTRQPLAQSLLEQLRREYISQGSEILECSSGNLNFPRLNTAMSHAFQASR